MAGELFPKNMHSVFSEFIPSPEHWPNKSAVFIRAFRDLVFLKNAVKSSAKISNLISYLSTTIP